MSGKDYRRLVRSLKRAGVPVEKSKRNSHYKVYCPDGSMYVFGSTPHGYGRVFRMVQKELEKRGCPTDAVYSFLTVSDLKQLEEDGCVSRDVSPTLPPVGSLVSMAHPFLQDRVFLVLEWIRIIDEEGDYLWLRTTPMEDGNCFVPALVDEGYIQLVSPV
jgi:hypothetical protein